MNKIKYMATGMVVIALSIAGVYFFTASKNQFFSKDLGLQDFKYDRDAQAIDDLFHRGDNYYWMLATSLHDTYSVDYMLRHATSSQYSPTHDLILKVLRKEDKIAGFLAYHQLSGHVWRLLFLIVDQDFRRQGIAKKLLSYAVSDMVARGAIKIIIGTRNNNFKAQKLYEGFGAVLTNSDDEFVHFAWYKH